MKFIGKFITEDLPGGEDVWKVSLPFSFIDSKGIRHGVPAGFISDGASIPRVLWPVVGHPRDTDIGQAAALHDLQYRYATVSRKRADEIICEGMECLGASWAKRKAVYAGLRMGGWVAWKRYRKYSKASA